MNLKFKFMEELKQKGYVRSRAFENSCGGLNSKAKRAYTVLLKFSARLINMQSYGGSKRRASTTDRRVKNKRADVLLLLLLTGGMNKKKLSFLKLDTGEKVFHVYTRVFFFFFLAVLKKIANRVPAGRPGPEYQYLFV